MGLSQHLTARAAERQARTETFLGKVREPLQKAIRNRQLTAADFNVFGASGIHSRELSHSHFLAELLNPDGTHGQGSLFLDSFLKRIDICKPEGQAIVHTEYSIDEARRLDILICFGAQHLLAIENKVNAEESEGQIEKYQEWLKRNGPAYTLVFLTKNGRKPKSGNPNEAPPTCLSYGDIADWIGEMVKKLPCAATRLRAVLDQYAECCSMLGGNMMCKLDENLLEHLRQETNLKMLFELEPYIDEIRKRIISDFVKKLKERLKAKDLDPNRDMEELQGKLTSEKYSRILWRHPRWPKGAGICLEFQYHDLSGLSGGFRAPNAEVLKEMNEQDKAKYQLIHEDDRQQIRDTVSRASSLFSNKTSQWWPVWNWLPHPLDDWKKTDALLMVAGFEPYQGKALVDWIAEEFVKIRKAVRPILG